MIDSSNLQEFLKEKGRLCPYRVSVRAPGGDWRVALETGDCAVIAVGAVPPFEQWLYTGSTEVGTALVWLRYPREFLIAVAFGRYVAFDASELRALYFLLYPCYAEALAGSLENQIGLLLKRDEIYSRLADYSAKNYGLEKITDELRNLLGRPLVFMDLITDRQYPAARKLPPELRPDRLTHLLPTLKAPQLVESGRSGQPGYYLSPVLSGGLCLGCFIVSVKQPLQPLDIITIEQGGKIAAIELAKNQSQTELFYRRAHQIFDELIRTSDPSELVTKCNELSIDYRASYVSVVFVFTTNIDLQLLDICVLRLITKLKKELPDLYQTVFCFENKVTLLASVSSEAALPALVGRLEAVIKDTQQHENVLLCAGMGSLYPGAEHIGKSYGEAVKALSYQVSHRNTGLISYTDIGINRLFINVPFEDAEQFVAEIFSPLAELTKNHNNNLEETLLAYIDLNCSAVKTAERLYIHVNTLYQRLNKIEEHLKVSLDNMEDLFRLWLACYLKRYYTGN